MADMCAGEGLTSATSWWPILTVTAFSTASISVADPIHVPPTTPSCTGTRNFAAPSGPHDLVNLKQVVEPVFTGFKDTTNPYDIPSMSEISWKTRRQGGSSTIRTPLPLWTIVSGRL